MPKCQAGGEEPPKTPKLHATRICIGEIREKHQVDLRIKHQNSQQVSLESMAS